MKSKAKKMLETKKSKEIQYSDITLRTYVTHGYPSDKGGNVLRLENLEVTNGPDLYVYLSTDKSASDFMNLGRLKANIGNQNYPIPDGTDMTKYGTVLIWCRAFSVLFGSTELKPIAA